MGMAVGNMLTSKMPVKPVMVVTAAALVGLSLAVPQRRVGSERKPCSTLTGSQCIFPFRHLGQDHHACTLAGSPVPWCATSTNTDGTLIQNKWGECRLHSSSACQVETEEARCLTVSGPRAETPCIFPFVYSGKVYNQCAEWIHGGENEGKSWCSTKVDNFDRHIKGQYGFCSSTCFEQKDQQPDLRGKVEEDKSLDEEDGAVVFYDEIPPILEHPK